MLSRSRAALLFLACLLALLATLFQSSPARQLQAPEVPAAAPGPPRLAVLIVFDQMRGDYLRRWQSLYGTSGFRRLCTEGAWFTNCHYPYANTVTAAGHASIATGCSPAEHGIVGNDWYDRRTGEKVNCVASGRYERVPHAPPQSAPLMPGAELERTNISPERLLAPTIGDALKAATHGAGRVVSLSLKDRSAVLIAGRHPDACYWFDSGSGLFATSTYYRERLHPWVVDFNRGRPADRWFGLSWRRLRPDLNYALYSGPDDVGGEGLGIGQGRTFPHSLTIARPRYYQALANSPFGNDLLLELARQAIDGEGLGNGAEPDFLSISFSSNDAIGHTWGPDSQEVMDVTLRSDVIIQKLLAYLDARVGRGRYVLAMTADHGVCPLPEVSAREGKSARRISRDALMQDVEDFVREQFAQKQANDRWLLKTTDMWLYLNQRLLTQRGVNSERAASAVAAGLRRQPPILEAYTRAQLLADPSRHDPLEQKLRRSFFPERSGDVAFVLKPYYLLYGLQGTNHGTPHPYDTHVPLVVYGAGVKPGIYEDLVTPQATASILTQALGIPAPAGAKAAVPAGLLFSSGD